MKQRKGHRTMNRRDFFAAGVATTVAAVASSKSGGFVDDAQAKEEVADIKLFPNLVTPNQTVVHDPKVCIGCNTCVEMCHQDIMIANPEKGKPPVVVWPDECWHCGICVINCPLGLDAKAITMVQPLCQRARWKRKATGEHFRIGMANPPAPVNRPPVGGWKAHS